MATPVDEETVVKLARLARLHIEKNELPALANDLGKILGYVAMLDGIDTTNVEPTANVTVDQLPRREDVLVPSLDHVLVITESPRHNSEGFSVPAFVEE